MSAVSRGVAKLEAAEPTFKVTARTLIDAAKANTASIERLEAGVLESIAATGRVEKMIERLVEVLGQGADPRELARASSADLSPEAIEKARLGTGLFSEMAKLRLHAESLHRRMAIRGTIAVALGTAGPQLVPVIADVLGRLF